MKRVLLRIASRGSRGSRGGSRRRYSGVGVGGECGSGAVVVGGGEVPKTLDEKEVHKGEHLQMKELTYVDPAGTTRKYESVERLSRRGEFDVVYIIPLLKRKDKDFDVVLISQYRPAVGKYCLEFPAGLMDKKGESVKNTGLRELKEETGYPTKSGKVTVLYESEQLVFTPGMSNENGKNIIVSIEEKESDVKPEQRCDEGEFCEVVRIPLNTFDRTLNETVGRKGWIVDAKVYNFGVGLNIRNLLS
eukprot:TRINITY_DN8663_c0_g1_i1.p1 TRINITY_DN8663_c0_g1~~TRINITY_DN8663_c0_g1_i1.p1  ORF type:complete len:247 (-),score=84.61 TRINITY_DN8663_c0_g1_i1:60-800(-)